MNKEAEMAYFREKVLPEYINYLKEIEESEAKLNKIREMFKKKEVRGAKRQ